MTLWKRLRRLFIKPSVNEQVADTLALAISSGYYGPLSFGPGKVLAVPWMCSAIHNLREDGCITEDEKWNTLNMIYAWMTKPDGTRHGYLYFMLGDTTTFNEQWEFDKFVEDYGYDFYNDKIKELRR